MGKFFSSSSFFASIFDVDAFAEKSTLGWSSHGDVCVVLFLRFSEIFSGELMES